VILELDDGSKDAGGAVVASNASDLYSEITMMTQAINARLEIESKSGADVATILKAVTEDLRKTKEEGTLQ